MALYGHLLTALDAESVHRQPAMIQPPIDIQPISCGPVAGPSGPRHQSRTPASPQHPELRSVPPTATECDSLRSALNEDNDEQTLNCAGNATLCERVRRISKMPPEGLEPSTR